ncbi:hypothetical protein [Salinithrix halophila]|uniref:Uncharacterized protein n=1 Tax=Salinithrix halophila TaxID=1485204 RepID=A0ABV8JJ54_9BACL
MTSKEARDNNGQREQKVSKGENRNGRLAPFKNHRQEGDPYPNEYLNKKEQ